MKRNRQNVGSIYSMEMLEMGMASDDPRSPEKVGERLEQLREAKGFGGRQQARFAAAMGLSPGLYNHYEKGRRPITKVSALRIADRCGVPVDWILTGNRSGLTQVWLNLLDGHPQKQAG
jgi:transcriptional regulator with XRE-family HTH domain